MKAISLIALAVASTATAAVNLAGPDGRLQLVVDIDANSRPVYSITYDNKPMLESSPLGFTADVGDFTNTTELNLVSTVAVDTLLSQDHIKQSTLHRHGNESLLQLRNKDGRRYNVRFYVGNNDVAFRYEIPKKKEAAIYIDAEATGFAFPGYTTTFLTPQSDPMIGWKRTKPSYEEEYTVDAPMSDRSLYGHGYTFPCLFKVGDDGWVLVSETGIDSHYCASHLSDSADGLYTIAFPMPGENNGNGNTGAAMALPGVTPWRTITVGDNLAPIVETTIPWEVVEPLYTTSNHYTGGRSTWSWILWQDDSACMEDQMTYVDLARDMGYEYVLVDAGWDQLIGRERLPELVEYARQRGVKLLMWYSSSGYWNDIVQSPVNCMDNPIVRKREMRWLHDLGIAGIKVDFFGGDKQETMRLYEAILSDADDNSLMVIFHGCTLPRGWERMYPNYVGSEAVLASENIYFQQHFCDREAFNATLHPFIRNTVGCMEFGGCFLNRYMSRGNDKGNRRVTTDAFELATTVLFQNPVQNLAIAPNNLEDAPAVAIDFLRELPTTWDETRFIDGYPGRYVVLARRHGRQWYVAGVNATDKPVEVDLSALPCAAGCTLYGDGPGLGVERTEITQRTRRPRAVMHPNGGFVAVSQQ